VKSTVGMAPFWILWEIFPDALAPITIT
jgi:hypothetical protein